MLSRVMLVLVSIAALVLSLGCQGVGPSFEQTKDGVNASELSPSTLAYSDGEGQETVKSTGPTYRTTITPDGAIQAIGGGLASREFIVPGKVLVRSNTDISGRVEELYGEGGELIAKGFEISTRTTEPQRAANEALVKWEEANGKLAAAQVQALEAEMETIRHGFEQIAPGLFDLVKGLVFPPAAIVP